MAEVAVVVLFGLPASGKSTLSRSVKDRFLRCRHDIATMYIEFDHFENKHRAGHDLLNLLKDETYDFASWKEGRKTALLELSAVLNRPSERKQIIVIDDTLHLRSMRKEIYRISSQCKNISQSLSIVYRPFCGFSADSTTQTHFIFVDAPVEVCVSRNLERQEGKPKKHSLSGHEEIHGSKQGSRDVVVAGPLAIPTDELIQNHSHVLNQECDAWRVKGQSSSPLHLVPIQFRYKWERAQNCFCWHLDAATVSAEDLAELLVEQFSRLVDEKRVSDVLPDTKPTSASCSGTSELDSHINVS